MNRTSVPRAVLALALAAGVSLAGRAALAGEPEVLRLHGNTVDTNDRLRTDTIDIVIERWSTPEETASLKAVLVEKGSDKLLSTLQKVRPRCGYVRTSTSLAWDIYFAREVELPGGGRKISLASDRPVGFWEASRGTRSRDYDFSLAEIRLGADGKGEGKAIKAALVSYDKEKSTLEIENYQREPVRLSQVSVVGPKPTK
jgi:hypothetical protein